MEAFAYFLLLLTLHYGHVANSLTSDAQALLALKSATTSTMELNPFANWNETDESPCHWTGISCMNVSSSPAFPRVVGISLGGKALKGYIPSDIALLLHLRHLNLHNNRLSGEIPPELFNVSSLRSVFLDGNRLSGSLSPSICSSRTLQIVDLSNNLLSGPLPSNLKECKQLQRLLLPNNSFSGQIPAGVWRELDNLIQLDLSSNQLIGFIPDAMGELGNLSGTLNLSFNHLSGQIPTALANLPATVIFDLKENNLSGEIPQKGSFSNQSPSAFLGNPLLCGSPLLHQPCLRHNLSSVPEKRLSNVFILLISAAEAAAVALTGLLFVYLYWKRKNDSTETNRFSSVHCFKTRDNKWRSSKPGAQVRHLVAFDKGFAVELDELLTASAYVLGKSRNGVVYKISLGNGEPVVVRRIGGGCNDRQSYREFVGAAQAIAKVKHPNIVKLRACSWSPDEKLLVSDCITNGNLAAALRGTNGNGALRQSWSAILKIAQGIARGLTHLHGCSTRKHVHGNIKPSNILIDSEWQPCISDFGIDFLITIGGSGGASSSGGLPLGHLPQSPPQIWSYYTAPELRESSTTPTQKTDVYSFGVILMELLTGVSPGSSAAMEVTDLVRLVRKRMEENYPVSEIMNPWLLREDNLKQQVLSLFHVALACTEDDPELRPRMKTVNENLNRIESL